MLQGEWEIEVKDFRDSLRGTNRIYEFAVFIALLLATSAEGRSEIRVLQVLSVPSTPGLPGPGSLATVYCTGLDGIEGTLVGSGVPLPTSLGGVRVTFGAVDALLLSRW
jgi:hypothetical protein